MSFLCSKPLIFSFLLINFTFSYQLVEPQTLIAPDFDEALLPFGSLAITGTFSRSCNRHDFDRAAFTVLNQCSFTVWAAAIPGGGRRLHSGDTWTFNVPSDASGRVWARTNCSFDSSGRGNCETGDCGGVLQCETFGSPPITLAEFALVQFKEDLVFFDISLVDGFNIPMEFKPTSNGCSRVVRCVADINGQCPLALRTAGGCNSPCAVFRTEEYCCRNSSTSCGPTNFSRFFKESCPNAYSYAFDDASSTFTCPRGTNYDVVFCPS